MVKLFTFEISFWFGWFIFGHNEIPVIYINNFSSLDFIDQRAHDSHPFNGITRCEDLSLSEDDSPSSHYKIPFEIRLLNASRSFLEAWVILNGLKSKLAHKSWAVTDENKTSDLDKLGHVRLSIPDTHML